MSEEPENKGNSKQILKAGVIRELDRLCECKTDIKENQIRNVSQTGSKPCIILSNYPDYFTSLKLTLLTCKAGINTPVHGLL